MLTLHLAWGWGGTGWIVQNKNGGIQKKKENLLSYKNFTFVLFQMEAPPLSPFPHIKQQPGSPRRISQQHSIYVSPHKNGSGLTPRSALLYKFNGSPSKVSCTQTLLQNNGVHVLNTGFQISN